MKFSRYKKTITAFLLSVSIIFSIQCEAQVIYTVAGSGFRGDNGDGGPAVCAGLSTSFAAFPDDKGNLYITGSNTIRKVDLKTGIITRFAGSGSPGYSGDGGLALNADMTFTYDMCTDTKGNFYFTQWDGVFGKYNYIRKINMATGIISTIAGKGIHGFSNDGGLAVDAIVDRPQGICTDPAGNIYFAEWANDRIRKIDMATGILTTIAGNGNSYSGDGGLAINAGISRPKDLAMDSSGNIYFTEVAAGVSSRIRKIDGSTGIITTIAGNNNYAHSGDGGPAIAASLFDPTGIVIDGRGNIYVCTYDDSRIRKIDAATGIINTIAGTGFHGFAGDTGPAINSGLDRPVGLSIDRNGDLYIGDVFNNRIRKITTTVTSPSSLPASVNIQASATTICPGTPVTFTATLTNGSGSPYCWQVNGKTVSTTGSVYTTTALKNGDIVNCYASVLICGNFVPVVSNNSITIVYGGGPSPAISIAANDTTICTGGNVIFTASAKNSGSNPSYQWKLNGANVGTNSIIFTSSLLADGDKVNCVVTPDPITACGTFSPISSDTITISVSSAVSPSINISASATDICPGASITFTANAQNTGISPFYQWRLNGVAAGNNGPVFMSQNFKDNDAVTCEVTGTGACSNTAVSSPIVIQVNSLPLISISPRDTIVSKGTQIQLRTSISVPPSSYQWIPSVGLTDPNMLSPITKPINTDTKFELSVISLEGCRATFKVNIKIFTKLFMPTAFTPNNDGLNDVFKIPEGVKFALKEFSVYDSWGNKIFTTSDSRKGWDGVLKGIPMPAGVYVYVISGSDDQAIIHQKGIISLIR